MNRATIAIACCVLAALGAIGWWLQYAAGFAPAPAPPVTQAPAPADAPHDATANAPERTLADAAATTIPAAAAAAPTMRQLEGAIVVADTDGSLHDDCDGFVELRPLPADANGSFTIAVKGGRWQAEVATAATKLEVGAVYLAGRGASCTETFALPNEASSLLLHATWFPDLRLRVIGSDTGIDLADLSVVQLHDWHFEESRHPGNLQRAVVLEHGRSPLRLRSATGADSVRYWIRAPGYAWDLIQLATNTPGERVLRLVPGGDVEVTFVGDVPDGAALRVRPRHGGTAAPPGVPIPYQRPTAEFRPAKHGVLRLDALPAGAWELSLEEGDWFREPIRLGAAPATVVAGQITPATVTVQGDVQRPPKVRVHGTLALSPKWGEDVVVEFAPSDALSTWTDEQERLRLDAMQPDGAGRHRWGPIELLAGRWEVTVRGTEHRAIADVGPGLPDVVDLVVPDPNEVRVRAVDATTGVPIPGASPAWYGTIDGWSSGWSHVDMEAVGDDWYRCLAGAGTIVIHCHPDGYMWSHGDYEVRPGPNEFVLRIARVCGVEIVLKDGDVAIPWPESAFAELEHTTTKAGVAYWSGNKVAAQEPGEHTLTLQPIAGYEPIPPRKVSIEPERWTRVEIQLQRAK